MRLHNILFYEEILILIYSGLKLSSSSLYEFEIFLKEYIKKCEMNRKLRSSLPIFKKYEKLKIHEFQIEKPEITFAKFFLIFLLNR